MFALRSRSIDLLATNATPNSTYDQRPKNACNAYAWKQDRSYKEAAASTAPAALNVFGSVIDTSMFGCFHSMNLAHPTICTCVSQLLSTARTGHPRARAGTYPSTRISFQ